MYGDPRDVHYKTAAVGGVFGFLLSLLAQWWPQLCAFLHLCAAT